MRIAHFVSSLDPDAGGPPAVALRIASAQASLGHRVIVRGGVPVGREDETRAFIERTPGIERVDALAMPLNESLAMTTESLERTLADLESAHRETPLDAVHFHGLWELSIVRIAWWCRKRGVPYIIRPAGMLDYWSMAQRALKKRIALATTHRALIRKASAIHALNPHERDAITRFRFGPPIDVIPNGVFLEEVDLRTEPGEFRRGIEGLGDSPYLLFLSRLHHKKGLDILADAWASLADDFPDVQLVVAGPRDDDSIDLFNKRIADAGLSERVFVVGAVYGRTKTSAIREATAFVLPSRQEGFSVAITESLALGTPAVVTRDCHFPDISEVDAGVETELSAESFQVGMRRILSDDVFRREAGERAAALIRERYTWPEIAKRCVSLYERFE